MKTRSVCSLLLAFAAVAILPAATAAAIHGPLRVHPQNPRYFTDDTGRALLLTGAHTWSNLVDKGPADPPAPFDFKAYLDWLEARSHNFIRLWTWEQPTWDRRGKNSPTPRIEHSAPQPWRRTGPGLAADGKPKFDLTQLDDAYFTRLRERVRAAGDRGIYASVMLFEGWAIQFSPDGWTHHPFNPANNINGIDGDIDHDGRGLETHEDRDPAITALQRAYVRRVIATLNDCDNLLYEISNENHPASTAWQYALIRFIKETERALPKQHPVGMTFQFKGGLNQTLFDSPADWISPGKADGYQNDPPAATGAKVILSDTDHLWGEGGDYHWVWRTVLSGMQPLYMDRIVELTGNPKGEIKAAEDTRHAMGAARRLAERIDFARLTPHGGLASSRFCLALPGTEYLVLVPAGAAATTVDLTTAPGSFTAEWIHPITGAATTAATVTGGATREFSSPFPDDAVLHLSKQPAQADRIEEVLRGGMAYDSADKSFSPLYSDIGLGFDANAGIAQLHLHYNRRTTTLAGPFLPDGGAPAETTADVLSVRQRAGAGTLDYAFYDHNSWLVEATGIPEIRYRFTAEKTLTEARGAFDATNRIFLFDGFLPTLDSRDADKTFPLVIGLRVLAGEIKEGDGLTAPVTIHPDAQGRIRLAFSVRMLEVDHAILQKRLLAAPGDFATALGLSRQWWQRTVGRLDFGRVEPEEEKALALAATTLAFNSCAAPGLLSGHIAQFPSRGGYPTHYLWDSCFQTLGLEAMDPQLARDAMLLLIRNQRPDGKIGQFFCSTWIRPFSSAPPLIGWATLNLARARNDLAFAREMLPGLVRNIDWWLAQQMTRYGLIGTSDPLETGCDNTPRLDQGPVLAVDMNSYLLMSMTTGRDLAKLTGDTATAERLDALARSYARKMLEVLYDPEANLFYDVLISTGQKVKIVTPANLIPLLTEVPLDPAKARAMIAQYLLNPAKLYGRYPFPSVAYDEPSYRPDNHWRGCIWMPQAWFMLEVLKKHGFADARREALARTYAMVRQDGRIMEKFNSATGAGLGKTQQGWTAAIFLKLQMELQAAKQSSD